MKVSANFKLHEFIDPDTFQLFGNKAIWFIDPRLIAVVQRIRELLGVSVTINNWATGGSYKLSGFRPPASKTGAKYSQHRFGRGADLKAKGLTPDQVLQVINYNWAELNALGLTTVEGTAHTPTWLHIDLRVTDGDELLIVNP